MCQNQKNEAVKLRTNVLVLFLLMLNVFGRFGIMPQTVAQKLREKTGYSPVPQHDAP